MNCKKILFNYILENEKYTDYPNLNIAEDNLLNSLSDNQKELFEKYLNEHSKFYNNRIYHYFCKGIQIKL